MKKLFVGIIAAALMLTGLVASTTVSASAAKYPHTVATKVITSGIQSKQPHQARIYVKITTFDEGTAKGQLRFTFINKRTGEDFTFQRRYDGSSNTYEFGGLPRGNYTVVVAYVPPERSKYAPSSGKTRAHVRG